MSVTFYLEIINTVLLLSGAALLISWKQKPKDKGELLIMRTGFCIMFIGLYKLLSVTFQTFEFNGWVPAISSIPALVGLVSLMFSLFNYLEAKK